jgi:hypothetical protein
MTPNHFTEGLEFYKDTLYEARVQEGLQTLSMITKLENIQT